MLRVGNPQTSYVIITTTLRIGSMSVSDEATDHANILSEARRLRLGTWIEKILRQARKSLTGMGVADTKDLTVSPTPQVRQRGDLRTAASRFCPKLSAYGIPPEFGATIVQGGPITEPARRLFMLFQLAPPPGASPKMAWIFQKLRTYSQNGNLLFPSLGFVAGSF